MDVCDVLIFNLFAEKVVTFYLPNNSFEEGFEGLTGEGYTRSRGGLFLNHPYLLLGRQARFHQKTIPVSIYVMHSSNFEKHGSDPCLY